MDVVEEVDLVGREDRQTDGVQASADAWGNAVCSFHLTPLDVSSSMCSLLLKALVSPAANYCCAWSCSCTHIVNICLALLLHTSSDFRVTLCERASATLVQSQVTNFDLLSHECLPEGRRCMQSTSGQSIWPEQESVSSESCTTVFCSTGSGQSAVQRTMCIDMS